jgi:indolepyruvate ferredoxin oxidoreductase alpha subunit
MVLQELNDAFDWALALNEPAVIITRWPCVLKRLSGDEQQEFGDYKGACAVDEETCVGCKLCIKTGCPALQFKKQEKQVGIDQVQCVGCEVCAQVCPKNAIKKVGE